MPRVFINLEAGCLQVNLMSTSAQINQLKYTILYYTNDIIGYTKTELHHRTISAEGRVKMRNEANRIKYGMVNPWADCIGLYA